MPASGLAWTIDRVLALPDDGNRYELIDGELLVTPSPRVLHQFAIGALLGWLVPYARSSRRWRVLTAPADIQIVQGNLVQPDVFVIPAGGAAPKKWADVRHLLLAVEVLSPSSARADRQLKRRFYSRAGVPDYWIVDADARVIERWRPSDDRPEILSETLSWQPDAALEPLVIDLVAYFDEVHED